MLNVVARVSNRVFVGQPLCECIICCVVCVLIASAGTGRKQEYLDIAVAFTIDLIKDKMIINLFPNSMRWSFTQAARALALQL